MRGDGGASTARVFLFTDIADSTRRWQSDVDMPAVLARHDELVVEALENQGGEVVKHTGDGFHAVFTDAGDAVAAARDVQRAIGAELWAGEPLRVRIGIHAGVAQERGGDYFGADVNHAARLTAVAHGGQIVLSTTARSALNEIPSGVSLTDLGEHRLRDIPGASTVHQASVVGLGSTFPALRSERVPLLVPAPIDEFIGREAEVTGLLSVLADNQLATLTGVGGTGKTRLAIEAARAAAEGYRGGVFFVDLSTVVDPAKVTDAVTAAVGLQVRAEASFEQLQTFLASRHCLIVLDNCEHLLDAVADLVQRMTSSAADTTLVLTSREPLGIPGEHVVAIPSLEPQPAAELFRARATAARRGWERDVDAATAELVEEICRRLDGIPLAIELAAARVGQLTVAQIADRLDDRFRLLAGPRRRLQRQQTLAAAMAWSWDLLTAEEQRLLRRLSVFIGTFDLDAVVGVCGPDPGDGPGDGDVLETLTSLGGKSLVVVTHRHRSTRYRLLETVRLYAEERLVESGEAETVRRRHRDWYTTWVTTLPGAGCLWDYRPYAALARAEPNVRAAIDSALDAGDREAAVRLVTAAGLWWQHRDGSGLSDSYFGLVAEAADVAEPELRTAALSLASMAARASRSKRWGEAERLASAAIDLADGWSGPALSGACGLAGVWRVLRGLTDADGGAVEAGLRLLDDALGLASSHPGYEFGARLNLNTALMSLERFDDSAEVCASIRSAAVSSSTPQPWAASYGSLCRTLCLLVAGRVDEAHTAATDLIADQAANRAWSDSVAADTGSAAAFRGLMFDGFPMATALEATGNTELSTEVAIEFGDWMLADRSQLADRADVFAAVGAWMAVIGHSVDAARLLGGARACFRTEAPFAKPVSVVLYRIGANTAVGALGLDRYRTERDAWSGGSCAEAVSAALTVARSR